MVSSSLLIKKRFVVYMFTFPNGKSYIGRTCDFSKRLKTHKRSTGCKYVHRCFKKYGNNVDITILKHGLRGAYIANQWERFFISAFNTLAPQGLNMTPGGDGVCFTQEIRDKIRKAHLGKKLSKEHRHKLSVAGKKRHQENPLSSYTRNILSKKLKGRIFTKEHCEKISIARKALKIRLTDEQKQHLRNINLGKKMSPEAIRKAVDSRIANGNHRHTEETKKKIGLANKGKIRTEKHRENMRLGHKNSTFDKSTTRKYQDEYIIKVLNDCDGNRNETAKVLGVHYNTVFRCLKRNGMTKK